jgi:hypothetical protein
LKPTGPLTKPLQVSLDAMIDRRGTIYELRSGVAQLTKSFSGAAGVIYVSVPIVFDTDPAKAIHPIVKGTINTLKASAEAGVSRYVLASSSKAVSSTIHDVPCKMTVDTFNHDAVRKASQATGEKGIERAITIYSAGRTASELAFWEWVKENDPPFVANCVVPDGNFGRVLLAKYGASGSSWGSLKDAMAGEWEKVPLQLGESCLFGYLS